MIGKELSTEELVKIQGGFNRGAYGLGKKVRHFVDNASIIWAFAKIVK